MSARFRHRVITLFLERKPLNERLAKNTVEWAHSGFSKAREALSEYLVHPPVSLQNLLVDEGGTDTVV
jgi:hypothetical protein